MFRQKGCGGNTDTIEQARKWPENTACSRLHHTHKFTARTCLAPASCSAIDVSLFQVVCTGKEDRLLDCDFPQDFGPEYFVSYNENNEYNENVPATGGGLADAACLSSDSRRFNVICRRFEIPGAVLLNTGVFIGLHSSSSA